MMTVNGLRFALVVGHPRVVCFLVPVNFLIRIAEVAKKPHDFSDSAEKFAAVLQYSLVGTFSIEGSQNERDAKFDAGHRRLDDSC